MRLILRADLDLEYVHLKDMRGACFEPLNVLSGYQWQGGLGYYESTKDVSTEFFFSSVPRGTYVFDYPLVVEQTGEFSNGLASVECLYAPEFAFHTEGIRINVEGGSMIKVDVLIVGQGICGTFLSRELDRAGLSYIVIDEERPDIGFAGGGWADQSGDGATLCKDLDDR